MPSLAAVKEEKSPLRQRRKHQEDTHTYIPYPTIKNRPNPNPHPNFNLVIFSQIKAMETHILQKI